MSGIEDIKNPKLTPEILPKLKARAIQIQADLSAAIGGSNGTAAGEHSVSRAAIARELIKEFPQFALSTLEEYSTRLPVLTDEFMELFKSGKINSSVLNEFVRGSWDGETIFFLAKEVIEKDLNSGHIKKIKQFLNKKGRTGSMADAINWATEDETKRDRRESVVRLSKRFIRLSKEVGELGLVYRAKISELLEDLPKTCSDDRGIIYKNVYDNVRFTRHVLQEGYALIDERVKNFGKELKAAVVEVAADQAKHESGYEQEDADLAGGKTGGRKGAVKKVIDVAVVTETAGRKT